MALCHGLTPNNICYSVDTQCIFYKLFKNIFTQWTKIVYQHIFSPRRMSIFCSNWEVEGKKSKLDSPVKVVSKSVSSLQTHPRKILKSESCVSDVIHYPFTVTASFYLGKIAT